MKSTFLAGLAASAAIASAAFAEDAVTSLEPDPDYVQACDAYGDRYWLIPGTETCLKVAGQLRYEKRFTRRDSLNRYEHWTRARVELTAKNDSELGTVESWVRYQNVIRNNGPATIDAYYTLGIGGLEAGYNESNYAQIAGFGGRTDDSGYYINPNYDIRQYISYTATFDKTRLTLSLENDRNLNTGLAEDGHDSTSMPDVVAGFRTTVQRWRISGVTAYDESDDSYAAAAFIRRNFSRFGITIGGYYANSVANSFFSYDGFSGLLGASMTLTEAVSVAADVQVWDNSDYMVIADISWKAAEGAMFLIEGAVTDQAEIKSNWLLLRFERSF
jgi:hypothetical protein